MEVTVAEGTNVLDAAKAVGIQIPHYCYHPALSIAGSCRLCVVELEKQPRLQLSCQMQAADGMVVHTNTERVQEARASILEFFLLNHPIDCPVCDQSGECWLQIYYMRHGLYQSRQLGDKLKKHKALPIGRHIILDSERCVLCSRCVRFCQEITHTDEMGLFERGNESEIGIFPGKELFSKYTGNLGDICPVGALTDGDFRFRCRVWYLDVTESICPLCSRGCNIEIHCNVRRPHQSKGQRILRLKPRFNPEVNQWWMCDEGRYGYKFIEDSTRLLHPQMGEPSNLATAGWPEIIAALAKRLRSFRLDEVAVLASAQLTNEEMFLVKRIFRDGLRIKNLDFRVPPKGQPSADEMLIQPDKNPNTRGAQEIGLIPPPDGLSSEEILVAAADGRVKALFVFHHEFLDSPWDPALTDKALSRLELLVFQGSNATSTCRRAHFILPAATFAEKDGTFTNFQGHVQRINRAVEPVGESLPDWEILLSLSRALDLRLPYASPRETFDDLASSVPSFSQLDYPSIGNQGAPLRQEGESSAR